MQNYLYCFFLFKLILRLLFQGESITDSLQISVTKPGFYFTAALETNLSLSSCGTFNVYCYLGEYKVNITTNNFGSCHLKGLFTLLIDLSKNSYIKFKSRINTVHGQVNQHRPFAKICILLAYECYALFLKILRHTET